MSRDDQSPPGEQPGAGGGAGRRIVQSAVLLVLLGAAVSIFDVAAFVSRVTGEVERLGIWGPVLFVAAYAAATVLFIPGSALTLAAGGLFGVGPGSVYVSLASTLGATLAFLLGRHLLRGMIRAKLRGNAKFAAIDEAVGEQGWKIVGLTRLSPAFPFTLLNYAYGLTGVSLRDYVAASWIGMMPGTVLYVYLGAAGKAAVDARGRTPGEWTMLVVGLVATACVTLYVTRLARRALKRQLDRPDANGISA